MLHPEPDVVDPQEFGGREVDLFALTRNEDAGQPQRHHLQEAGRVLFRVPAHGCTVSVSVTDGDDPVSTHSQVSVACSAVAT